jgi:hypothetical protein
MLSDEDLPPALASLLTQEVLRGGGDGAREDFGVSLPAFGTGADRSDWELDEMSSHTCLSCGGRFFSSNDECMACGVASQRRL